jgi:hypothetical protein
MAPPLEDIKKMTKRHAFKKESRTSREQPKKCAYQEADGAYHAMVLSHFAYGRHRRKVVEITGALNFGEQEAPEPILRGLHHETDLRR